MKKSIIVRKEWQFGDTIYEYIKNAKLDGCDISLTDIKFMIMFRRMKDCRQAMIKKSYTILPLLMF